MRQHIWFRPLEAKRLRQCRSSGSVQRVLHPELICGCNRHYSYSEGTKRFSIEPETLRIGKFLKIDGRVRTVLKLELPLLHCYRCGDTWTPRNRIVRICPRCKSPHWEEPRIRIPTGGRGLGVEEVLGRYRSRILQIARRYRVREIRVFGSLARNEATDKSDVDFLVDFDWTKKTRSSLRTADIAQELEALLGRRVDVVTEDSLHWFIQPQVVVEAVPL
jgi:uncharacterized protein